MEGNKVKGFLVLIAAYVGINVLLWGGQELYYKGTENEIEANEKRLDALKAAISTSESELALLENSQDEKGKELAKLQVSLDELKKEAGESKTLPGPKLAKYKELRSNYNKHVKLFNQLGEQYDSKYSTYQDKLQEHNALVDTTNEKIKSVHKFLLIPIPLPKRALK